MTDQKDPKDDGKTTPVRLPPDLRARIEAQMKHDKRTVVPEILVLIEEALERREKRNG